MVPNLTDMTQIQVFSKFPKAHVDFLVFSMSSSAPHGTGEGGRGSCAGSGAAGRVECQLLHNKNKCMAIIWHLQSPRCKDIWGKPLTYNWSLCLPTCSWELLPEAEGLWKDSRITRVTPGTPQIHKEWGAKWLCERGMVMGKEQCLQVLSPCCGEMAPQSCCL